MNDGMINLTVVDREGKPHELEGPTFMDLNVMELCKAYGLPVEGTCGGMALCASCHLYILSNHGLSPASNDEENMLDQAFFVQPNSRLGCQIHLHTGLDGLVVQLAKE
ncbi:MAG: 2Fe-2S iron-sulfur cluster binding domain-containing protein [Saprospirales bacterium]|nr:2Fe-2S iron-sulfur cluster binding domain-containing protein [Saprospirales bacterium]